MSLNSNKFTKMKDVCLCIIKENGIAVEVHSIGVNNGKDKYYSEEGGGCFNLERNKNIFEYREMSWEELRVMISDKL